MTKQSSLLFDAIKEEIGDVLPTSSLVVSIPTLAALKTRHFSLLLQEMAPLTL